MSLNLNELVDAIFKGIVLVAISFVVSLSTVLSRPGRGAVALLRRLRNRKSEQVKPRVFLFLAIALALASPMLVGLMQKPAADFYAVKIYDSSAPELGQLADVYKGIEEQTKSQRFFALALAAIVGVAVFHLAGELIGRGLFFTSQRRTLVMDGLMFVCGAQFVLFGGLYVFGLRFEGFYSSVDVDLTLVSAIPVAAADLFGSHGNDRWHIDRWVCAVFLIVIAATLLLPLPISRYLSRRSRLRFTNATVRQWSPVYLGAVLLALIANAAFAGSFAATTYVYRNIQPRAKEPYALSVAHCDLRASEKEAIIEATAVATITGEKPWLFEHGDFKFHISAKRTSTDPPPRRPNKISNPDRIGSPSGPLQSVRVGTPSTVSPVLVEPQKSAVLLIRAAIDDRLRTFLASHPDDRRCTLWDANDNLIGAMGPLQVDERLLARP